MRHTRLWAYHRRGVRDIIATGDPVLKAIVTKGKKVLGVVHMRRRPNAYQKSALDWLFPTCAANGCGTRGRFLETDHREDWARTHVTVLGLLDRLCRYRHSLKTRFGWALVEGRGKRDFVPRRPEAPSTSTARCTRCSGRRRYQHGRGRRRSPAERGWHPGSGRPEPANRAPATPWLNAPQVFLALSVVRSEGRVA